MNRLFRGAVAGAWFALLLPLFGCGPGSNRVEILDSPPSKAAVLRIAVSDEVFLPFRRLTDTFGIEKGCRIEIVSTESAQIPGLLRSGAVDAGVTAGGIPADAAGFTYIPFARDRIVFLVSKEAGIDSLTTAQLRNMLRGEITDWKSVGGKPGPVHIVDRPVISTSRRALAKGLFRGDFPVASGGMLLQNNELAVQAMRNLPGFLGFVSMSVVTTGRLPGVPLTVDGMPPLLTGFRETRYPASIDYGILFTKNAPTGVRDLAEYLLSKKGGHALATQGMSPASMNFSMTTCHCRERERTFEPASGKSVLLGTFTIAVVPEFGAIEQENRYAAITQQIADGLGARARLLHLESYRQVLNEFSEGRVDAAFVGSLMYAKLHRRMNVVPLARPELGTVSRYRGLIIARRGTGARTFEDLKGKRFAYVPDTSAGELFSRASVNEAGGTWPGFFSEVIQASSHHSAIRLVLSGSADAAAVKDRVFLKEQASSQPAREELVVLSTSGYFPENAFVVAGTIGIKDRSSLQSTLLGLDRNKGGRDALHRLGADRMIPTSDEDYSEVYALSRKVRYPLGGGK
jgi:phosphonate transport system substrate-binding protein